ncbi:MULTISPECIES: DUF262 domain-containing protein [Spirulina sp. CCY15215]|uniref:DUF262 domain-containing protein n=1 Tax=Spirulina sp. CCY15215 TaxID=2767591 RepID=UPI001950B8D4|nr:DUF262 domain-containing protein [Spirulina major]
MKASEEKLDRFLSQNETQFVIPIYQRNYDWKYSECGQLLDDIFELGKDDNLNAHFIGSIVYIHDDVYFAGGIRELTIIDGQQRLTTVTLIYLVLYRLAKLLGNDRLVNQINKTYLINEFADDEEKLKLRPTDNNDRALKYLLRDDPQEEYHTFSRLIENFNYFKTKINENNYEFVRKGLKKLMFVKISLEREKDDPQRIFESLNSTGLALSQADLIRNYILMRLNRKSQNQIYDNYWEYIEQLAKDELKNESRVSDYIRDYLTLENKRIPNKNKVYQEFKDKYPISTIEELEKNLKSIKKFVIYYNKLLNPAKENDKDIRLQLEFIKQLEINVTYPFLLKIYDDYSTELISKKIFIGVLEIIQSFTWRRFIIGLPPSALNQIFMRLYEDVNHENYLPSIQFALTKKKGSQIFPRDTEVLHALKEKNMYDVQSKNRIYFLKRLENYENKEPVKIEDNDSLTIEHIFPQNPDPQWKIDLGKEEYNLIRENYVNTIANLTLSGNNGKLGNKPFLIKRDMNIDGKEQGYKYSRLWLNRYLTEIDRWGKEEIEKRFEIIKERFLKIWIFPEVEVEEKIVFDVNIFDAEEPTGKKLEYAIFFDRKLDISSVTDLYLEVMKILFNLQPETFFTSSLSEYLRITKDPQQCSRPNSLNETYFIDTKLSSKHKFDRLKKTLTILDCEDELMIKYKD